MSVCERLTGKSIPNTRLPGKLQVPAEGEAAGHGARCSCSSQLCFLSSYDLKKLIINCPKLKH